MSDLTEESTGANWWTAAEVAETAEMLASRRSRLWQRVAPEDLAAWVFADPDPVPLQPAPSDVGTDWATGRNRTARRAWGLAGWVARTAIPEAAATAGKTWHLSYLENDGPAVLRLTVGVLEILGLYEAGGVVWLRVHAGPIVLAMDAGVADLEEWGRRGIDVERDGTKTLAEEKLLLTCPDLDTAFWLLQQPSVVAGLRLLSSWVAAGPYPFEGRYRPEVAGRAWQASASLDPSDRGDGRDQGYDRPYAGPAMTADLPTQRSFDAAAYGAGVAEHDRLCRLLIDHLLRSGVRAGAGLVGIPVDLAWRDSAGRPIIAEVKSVVGDNEVEQLRLGLGQVLEYRHRLAARSVPVTAVLLVSRCGDLAWWDICAGGDVVLLSAEDPTTWTLGETSG
ncbi:hypothetical protein V6U81_01610 [Micromonospora sp. CPCC 205711]|uniref:hypothetical protein n=1 Tax=Micromonospora sp. CPCC 205547 TaxID=3122400 RepID=UPI002FEF4A9A